MGRWRGIDLYKSGAATVFVQLTQGAVSGEAMLRATCKCGWETCIYVNSDQEKARESVVSRVEGKHECLGDEFRMLPLEAAGRARPG